MISSTLNSKCTFDTFVVGNSNRFAFAAAQGVAAQPGKAYNPLFIYSGVGLGKTHLLHAIGNAVLQANPEANVLYLHTEDFLESLVKAMGSGAQEAWREDVRAADVLLLDDIQFLEGKESTQEEFFHIFNTLHNAGKQVVAASDRPPKRLSLLEERLISRFEGGLIADISPPEYETRLAILRNRSATLESPVADETLEYIARNVVNSVRSLKGALTKLEARAQLQKNALTQDEIMATLREFVPGSEVPPMAPEPPKPLNQETDRIQHYVSQQEEERRRREKEAEVRRQIEARVRREVAQSRQEARPGSMPPPLPPLPVPAAPPPNPVPSPAPSAQAAPVQPARRVLDEETRKSIERERRRGTTASPSRNQKEESSRMSAQKKAVRTVIYLVLVVVAVGAWVFYNQAFIMPHAEELVVKIDKGSGGWSYTEAFPNFAAPPDRDKDSYFWYDRKYQENQAKWKKDGKMPFVLGNSAEVAAAAGKGGTTLSANRGGYYFRKHFNVQEPRFIPSVDLKIGANNSAEVYLNGHSIYKNAELNVGKGAAMKYWNEEKAVELREAPLLKGDNVLAVYLFNDDASGDAALDLQLNGGRKLFENQVKAALIIVLILCVVILVVDLVAK